MKRLFTALIALALPGVGFSAVITPFADRASWVAAAGTIATEDFESVTPITASTGGDTFELDLFSIVIDANHGYIEIDSEGNGPVIGGSQSFFGDAHFPSDPSPRFQRLVFNEPILAFSADFANGDAYGLTIHVLGEMLPFSFLEPTFFGIVSDTAFTSLEIRGGLSGSGYFVMDNVSISAVSEPGVALLLATGVLVFSLRRKTA